MVHINYDTQRLLALGHLSLRAIGPTVNKSPVRVLAAAGPVIRTLDATGADARRLSIVIPEERPAILVDIGHLRVSGRGAGVRLAGSVGSSMGGVVLVVRDEDGKGLCFGCARVVGTFRGLDCLGGLCGRAVVGTRAFALGVGGCWVESSQRKCGAEKHSDQRLGQHDCGGLECS